MSKRTDFAHSARQLGQDSQLHRWVRIHLLAFAEITRAPFLPRPAVLMRNIWSVFMRRLKTPLYEHKTKAIQAPLIPYAIRLYFTRRLLVFRPSRLTDMQQLRPIPGRRQVLPGLQVRPSRREVPARLPLVQAHLHLRARVQPAARRPIQGVHRLRPRVQRAHREPGQGP